MTLNRQVAGWLMAELMARPPVFCRGDAAGRCTWRIHNSALRVRQSVSDLFFCLAQRNSFISKTSPTLCHSPTKVHIAFYHVHSRVDA